MTKRNSRHLVAATLALSLGSTGCGSNDDVAFDPVRAGALAGNAQTVAQPQFADKNADGVPDLLSDDKGSLLDALAPPGASLGAEQANLSWTTSADFNGLRAPFAQPKFFFELNHRANHFSATALERHPDDRRRARILNVSIFSKDTAVMEGRTYAIVPAAATPAEQSDGAVVSYAEALFNGTFIDDFRWNQGSGFVRVLAYNSNSVEIEFDAQNVGPSPGNSASRGSFSASGRVPVYP
jgi:hypothetical protein